MLTSPGFVDALVTTLVYSVGGTACAIGLGLVAALALRRPFRGRGLVRACMLLPYVAPVVAATFLWKTMLNPQFGIINHYGTTLLGWNDPIAFLSSAHRCRRSASTCTSARPCSPWCCSRRGGRSPSRSCSSPPGCRRSRAPWRRRPTVDGAAPTQRFRYIVLPQLLPTIAVLTVLRFIWTFNNFDDIYLLTGGGAGTQVVAVRVYDYLINRGDIGAAAAQAWCWPRSSRSSSPCTSSSSAGRRRSHEHSAWSPRDRVERPRASACSRCGLIIVLLLVDHGVPLLLHGAAVVPAARRRAAGPGRAVAQAGEIDLGTYRDVLQPRPTSGGQGFLDFIKNSVLVAVGTVVLTLLVASPARTP